MTVMMKEIKRMSNPTKTYLEIYKEHVTGYKEYKMQKAVQSPKKKMVEPASK